MTDDPADLYFAPTGESKGNLLKEKSSGILYCGDEVLLLMLKLTVQESYHHEVLDQLDPDKSHPGLCIPKRKSRSSHESDLWSSERNGGSRTEYQVVYPVHRPVLAF